MTIAELKSKLTDFDAEETKSVSPYEAAKICNKMLQTNLPPQMFYNYVKKSYISATFSDADGWRIEVAELRRFIERYALRNIIVL